MEIEVLSVCVLIAAAIAIAVRYREKIQYFAVFKPLTTTLILIIAILIHIEIRSFYSAVIIISLIFSLIGDILLIDKNRYFLHGLLSFLVAHIGFTIAFSSIFGFRWSIIPLLFLVPLGGSYYIYIKGYLQNYSIPVAIYIVVLIGMNWQAIGLLSVSRHFIFYCLAIGSLLFSFSDALIAYNRFRKPFKLAEFLILSTYWIAIYIFTIAGMYIYKFMLSSR